MSSLRPISDNGTRKPPSTAQGCLDLSGPEAMFRGVPEDIRRALVQDLRETRLSREQVAIDLSALTGRDISVPMIDAFLAESKPHRFPLELLPAWIWVTGSRRVLDLVMRGVGLSIATEEDMEFAELGRTRLRDEKLSKKLWNRV